MYQDIYGITYNDDGSRYDPTTAAPPQFINTSPAPRNPTGIPDPKNPGYDTAGYKLGSSTNANGTINIPSTTGVSWPGITHNVPNTADTGTSPTPTAPLTAASTTSTFGALPTIPNVPAFTFEDFQAPAPFSYGTFNAPTADQVATSDPGYAFRLNQGLGALQNSAAARGVLNTGGTLKDIEDYGQSAASQEYQNAFNRDLGAYTTNANTQAGIYNMNFNDALNSWLARAGNALTAYNTNYQTQYQNPYLAAMQQYQQGVANQGQIFNQQYATATA